MQDVHHRRESITGQRRFIWHSKGWDETCSSPAPLQTPFDAHQAEIHQINFIWCPCSQKNIVTFFGIRIGQHLWNPPRSIDQTARCSFASQSSPGRAKEQGSPTSGIDLGEGGRTRDLQKMKSHCLPRDASNIFDQSQ